MESYNQRIKDIQLLDELSTDEKRELLEDLRLEIEMDDAVSDMETKATLLKTVNLLMKVI